MTRHTALNASRMKSSNYRRILDELRISPFSRSDLARRTGLTRAAISLIADELLQAHIIVEGNTVAPKASGRSSTELHWNKDAFYCIGLCLRRNYFGVGLHDFCGNLIASEYADVKAPYNTREAIFEKICEMIDNALETHTPSGKFLGIGVGAPGPIDDADGIIDNPTGLEILHKAPIVPFLQTRYHCNVVIKNDACSQALAELSYGVKDKYDSFFVLEITGGIGGGLILNRKLVSGTLGNGNEVGHTTINAFGVKCKCGNTGCAELYATLPNIVAYALETDPRFTSWKNVVDLAYSGDSLAIDVIKREAFYISTLCVNMLNILDFEAIIINGREITYRPVLLLSLIRDQIPARLLVKRYRKVDLITSSITEYTDILSAANLVLDDYLKKLNFPPTPQ
ncbi:MAG: ROK family transcriptional regulator [Oscillospiraceae bacterium]